VANEITFTGSLSVYKSTVMSSAISRAVAALQFNMTGSYVTEGVMSVATSATAIPLGGVTSPAWGFFMNKDQTNFIRLMNGSGGAKVVKMMAGEPAIFRWDDTATPYAIADTSACLMEYLIVQL
jgi:hypothetical protein